MCNLLPLNLHGREHALRWTVLHDPHWTVCWRIELQNLSSMSPVMHSVLQTYRNTWGPCSVRSLSWELLSCGETLPTDTYFNTSHVSQTCTTCLCCTQYTKASIPQVHLWRLVLWAAATKGLVIPQWAPLASEVSYGTSSTSCTTSESGLLVLRYFQRKCIHISQIDRFSLKINSFLIQSLILFFLKSFHACKTLVTVPLEYQLPDDP